MPKLTDSSTLADGFAPHTQNVELRVVGQPERGRRLIDFVYHSTLSVRVIKKKKEVEGWLAPWGIAST